MSVLYTKRDIERVLKELRIKARDDRVDAGEAARILSWRACQEQGIAHIYTPTTVRKHRSKLGATHPMREDGTPNIRTNLYNVESIFNLDIKPKRTNPGRWKEQQG